jgi:two-component system, cell cycle response regulator
MSELKTRILVVDDDQRLRELLVRYLGGEGHEVKAVPDAGAMDKQLARERYDLVVLDLMLPGEDGLAICRRLRTQQTAPAIIMLTAKGDDVDRIVGLEMGADDYLPKPFDPVLLRARINAGLARKRLDDLEQEYLEQVGHVVAAAAAVESGTFESGQLDGVARRGDALGQLARVFQRMATEVQARERRLTQEVHKLRIEIDEVRAARQVAEITETEYFQDLQRKVSELRLDPNA